MGICQGAARKGVDTKPKRAYYMTMSHLNHPFKVFLGFIKGTIEPVYLNGFSWDCGWYWGGGYIGNTRFHAHFNGAFLDVIDERGHCLGNFVSPWKNLKDYEKATAKVVSNGCSVWESLVFFLDNPAIRKKNGGKSRIYTANFMS